MLFFVCRARLSEKHTGKGIIDREKGVVFMTNYVIVGGDAAGMSAAMEIVRADETAHVTTLERGNIYSYGQCGLPYVLDGRIASTDRVIARTPDTFREKYGIDARVGHEVMHLDRARKEVSGRTERGETFTIPYDRLLIATGAEPVRPNWPGAELAGIQSFKTIPDTKALIRAMQTSETITIIGGGYIGLEVAEALTEAGKRVRLIQRGPRVAAMFSERLTEVIEARARENGIELLTNESVESFEGDERVERVVTNRGSYATDHVIVAIGVRPATQWAEEAGLATLPNGAIRTDRSMQTSDPSIYAAGDCAAHFHRVSETDQYVPLGTTANKQGRVAGRAMAGRHAKFRGILGTSIMKFFDVTVAKTGLNEADGKRERIACAKKEWTGPHIAGYYPGNERLTTILYYDERTRRLLGGEWVGGAGVDKRVDVVATAIHFGASIDELLDLDLSYAPPFNGVWDPIQQVARRMQP